jgi:hypothetical protein
MMASQGGGIREREIKKILRYTHTSVNERERERERENERERESRVANAGRAIHTQGREGRASAARWCRFTDAARAAVAALPAA